MSGRGKHSQMKQQGKHSSICTNINKTIYWPSLGRKVQRWGLGRGGGRGRVGGGEESLGGCHSVLGL